MNEIETKAPPKGVASRTVRRAAKRVTMIDVAQAAGCSQSTVLDRRWLRSTEYEFSKSCETPELMMAPNHPPVFPDL